MMIRIVAIIVAIMVNMSFAMKNSSFTWGAASASYQVEGQIHADNRGKSIWDVYLSDESLGGPGISGATSINFYDTAQYKEDIALFKRMGLKSYRFSISWPRIMPDGLGPVNMAGINHYREFITQLKAAGIEPLVTLYHWDMPASLAAAGSWHNRDSVDWFKKYAEVIFDHFHDLVQQFVLINEPTTDVMFTLKAETLRKGDKNSSVSMFPVGSSALEETLRSYNHILLSAAGAKEVFDNKNYTGSLGLSLALAPVLTSKNATSQDSQVSKYVDGILNRWFLDSIVNGTYPQDILDLCEKMDIDPKIREDDAATIGDAELDYIGVNYYAPTYVKAGNNSSANKGYAPESYDPHGIETMANGPVQPEQLKELLLRIKEEYRNIPVYVTENGAAFKGDDVLRDGKVLDVKRCKYIVNHIEALEEARDEGADVRGYYAWSSHDNLEWLSGYSTRFGLCYVNYETQERTPKLSSKVYGSITRGHNVTTDNCEVKNY